MAQKGEEMTDTQVRLMERIERTTAELIRLKRLCGEVEEATENIVSGIFGPPEKCCAQEQEGVPEIDMTKPQPCTRFRDAGTVEWIAKLMEETNEVVQEAVIPEENADEDGTVDHDKYGLVDVKKRLSMELTDVIHVCVSWLDAEGWDEEARGELHRRVNEKNRERGYFGID